MNQYEEKARGLGWKPKDEWQGPDEEWVTARSFVEKGEMISKLRSNSSRMHQQEQELASMRKSISDLKTLQQNTAKFEFERARKELLRAKTSAYEEGDHAKVIQVEEQIREIDKETDKIAKEDEQVTQQTSGDLPENQNPNHPAYVDWYNENKNWYDHDIVKSALWDKLANLTMMQNPNISPYDFLDTVSHEFNKELGKMSYQSPRTKVGSSTDSGENVAKSKDNGKGEKPHHKFKDLPDDLKEVAKNFVATGAFENYEDIIRQWEEIGTLPRG